MYFHWLALMVAIVSSVLFLFVWAEWGIDVWPIGGQQWKQQWPGVIVSTSWHVRNYSFVHSFISISLIVEKMLMCFKTAKTKGKLCWDGRWMTIAATTTTRTTILPVKCFIVHLPSHYLDGVVFFCLLCCCKNYRISKLYTGGMSL